MRFLRPLGYIAAGAIIGLGAATAYNNIDSIKQKFSYPTFTSTTQSVSGAAKLAEAERKNDKQIGKTYTIGNKLAATPKPIIPAQDGPCRSDYPNIKLRSDAEVPDKIKKGAKVLCAYVGDFLRNGQGKLVGIAYSDESGKGHFGVGPFLFFFERSGEESSDGVFRGLDSMDSWDDFKLEKFKITNVGLKQAPQVVIEYTNGGKRHIEIYGRGYESVEVKHMRDYTRVALAEGDKFHFADLDGDGVQELLVSNGGQAKGIGAAKKPLAILAFVPATFYQDGTVFDRYYLDRPFGPVAETQSKLVEAAVLGNTAEVERIRNISNPYVFFAATAGLLDFSTSDQLLAELYGNPAAFLDRLFSSPQNAAIIFGAFATQRFFYHVQTRNDGFIHPTGSGYAVSLDGKTGPCCFTTIEEARKEVLNMQRREQQQANAPASYHTFRSTTTDPKTGVTTEKRTTSVGGPPKTPAQWETDRAVQKDPLARGLNEAYQKAGAAKGEVEKKAGEVSRNLGRALNEAAGNINRAIEDAKRRR